MKLKNNSIKWLSGLVIASLFFNFTVTLPSVLAQGETPSTVTATPIVTSTPETEETSPTATATPTELPAESTFLPTVTPTPTMEDAPPALQPLAPSQSLQQSTASTNPNLPIWPAFNISDTDIISKDASIAVDSAGRIHFVWVEQDDDYANDVEIMYSRSDLDAQKPVTFATSLHHNFPHNGT
jgi:hypothetical protein